MSVDPLKIVDINPYTYCYNNPIVYTDAYGLLGEKEVMAELDKYFGDRLSKETKKKIADFTGKKITVWHLPGLIAKDPKALKKLEERVRKALEKADEATKKAFEEMERLTEEIEKEKKRKEEEKCKK